MSWRFSFEVDGVAQFDRAFNRVSKDVQDLRPVWEYAERALEKIEREQFDSEGAAGLHGKWQELSPRYKVWKEEHWPGRKILQREYNMIDSLIGYTVDSIRVSEPLEFAFGTKAKSKSGEDYPLKHQRGIPRRLPIRRPIDLSESQRRDLAKAMQKGLLIVIKAHQDKQFDLLVESGEFDSLR